MIKRTATQQINVSLAHIETAVALLPSYTGVDKKFSAILHDCDVRCAEIRTALETIRTAMAQI